MSKKKPKTPSNTIAQNRKARHDFHIEETFEAGLALEGWEVKSLRAGRAQLVDSYVIFKQGEAWLLGALISPLETTSKHFDVNPARTRKLLLNLKEINDIRVSIERKGFTCVALELYWKKNLIKLKIGLAKGKKQYDKRQDLKDKDLKREQDRQAKG